MAKSNVERSEDLLRSTSFSKGVRSYATERLHRVRVATPIVGESRTKQSFKDECDINVLMKRYQATGILPGADRAAAARFLDCTNVDDYHSAMLRVAEAKSVFAGLPAVIRNRFGNDPGQMIAFCDDPRNLEEARELGLARPAEVAPEKPAEVPPIVAKVVDKDVKS